MIGKKVPNPKKSSTKTGRVTGLTNYITAPENANSLEKCVHYEASNFLTDDLQSQQVEMIALATTAVRSKDPIDHYVLSWQEGETPTITQAREAVEMTMKHLGLEGHQVVWGLHDDTGNMHVHIAINRIHPETLLVVEVNKGFQNNAIQQAAAIVEKVQGWKVHDKARFKTDELGHLITDSKTKLPQVFNEAEKKEPTGQAKDKEIQTGQKSAQRIGIENAPQIINAATSWEDLHSNMQAAGMEYRRDGSGAKIYVGNIGVKASDVVDRKNNFGALQKRLGLYQQANTPEIKNDPLNRTKLVTDNRFTTGYDEQNIAATGFGTFNTLRDLSGSNLDVTDTTNWQKSKNQNLLQSYESSDNRRTSGVRRGSDSDSTERGSRERDLGRTGSESTRLGERSISQARRPGDAAERIRFAEANGREETGHDPRVFRQPLKDNQPGWQEYISIRDTRKASKANETIELQIHHGDESAALSAKQKKERDVVLKEVPKGSGAMLNIARSALAVKQAPEKLELQERQRAERKRLQAKYKPLPLYRQWKEQPQIVGIVVLPFSQQHLVTTVAQTLRSLTNSIDARNHITYQLNKRDVFRDEGQIIQVLDLQSEQGIAAALATAQQKFGNVLTLTGSSEFQQNAVAVAVANNLTCKFADPALDALRARLQADKYLVERATATDTEKAAVGTKTPSNPTREAVRPVPVPEAQQQPVMQPEFADPGTAYDGDDEHYREIDYLEDIHKQVDAAKAAADPRSMLAHSVTTKADHEAPDHGVIIGSNAEFVAVQRGEAVKLYLTLELTKQLKYDGIDDDNGRFAPGNEIERKNGKDGMRTLLSEEREAMKTEAKRERERDTGHGL